MLDGDEAHDWATFADRTGRLANGLLSLGVRPGDRVGILALNCRAYLEAQFSIWWMGAVLVPMNTRWSTAENLYVLGDASIRFLFADRNFYGDAIALAGAAEDLTLIGMDDEAPTSLATLPGLLAKNMPASLRRDDPAELAGVFYTGGTTGKAKGVMLTHGALWVNAMAVCYSRRLQSKDRILHSAPLFHLAGGGLAMGAVVAGACQAFLPKFVAGDVIAAVDAIGVTKMILVPTMIQMLVDDAAFEPARLSTLNMLVFGGSPIPDALLRRLIDELPGLLFVHAYGQTEMGPGISYLDPDWQYPGSPKLRSVGKPTVSVEARIVDEDGNDVAQGVPGEVWTRGPGQMIGYLNKPEETRQTITEDGWIRTGDIAYQDEGGFLYICDRAKDMIISGGENIFSGEVESAISTHPAVQQVAVVGIPDADYGERVQAVVVLQPGQSLELDALRLHCRAIIAPFKCPRGLEIRDELPVSAQGKVLKNALRAPYWAASATATGRLVG